MIYISSLIDVTVFITDIQSMDGDEKSIQFVTDTKNFAENKID
jgi:hypothetical protein